MKGISSSIAAIIIATISITLAGTTYFYTQGLMKGLGAETFEIIDVFNNLIIVKNLGTQEIKEFKVLVDGQEIIAKIKEPPIQPGEVGTIILTLDGIPAGRHELTIISKSMSQRWTWEFQYVATTMETTVTTTTTIFTTTTTGVGELETIEIESDIKQGFAEVGKPVKWSGKMDFSNLATVDINYTANLMIPEDASKIMIKDLKENVVTKERSLSVSIAGRKKLSYLVEYETTAPYMEERTIKPFISGEKYVKKIFVKSLFTNHYKDVKAYTDIPEELSRENYIIKLYRVLTDSKIDVTDSPQYNVKFVDSDNDGMNDRIEWNVPMLSEEEFEVKASITIINVQSYPAIWGNWTVKFNTTGIANLTITPINDTNFDVDIKFLELRCGNNKVNPLYDEKSVFYANWSCSEEGRIINQVLKEGKHTLEFSFGNDVEYAFNQAGLEYYINTSETEQSTGTSWRESLSLTWDDPSNSKWLVLASWESRDSTTSYDANYQVSKDGAEQALYVERVLQANNEYISYFFPQVHEGDGGTVKYSVNFRQITAETAFIRRVRLVAIRLDNLLNVHYNYSFNEIETSNLDSTWGGAEDTTVTVSPSTDGWYLILASLAKNSDSTSRSALARLVVDSEFIPSSTGSYGTIEDTSTTEFHPFQVIAARQLNAGSHTISLQAISESQSFTDIRDRSVVVLRLSDVFPFFRVSDTGQTSTTSTTFQNKSSLTIPSGNDGNYLILSMFTLRGGTTGYDYESRAFSDDYGEIGKFQRFRPKDATDYITSSMVYNTTFDANQHVIKNQFRREDALGTAYAKNSEIVAIKLNASVITTSFNITLPGLSPIEASGTQPGTLTTPIEFNASNPTESNVQPCVVGYGCLSGYKQDASTSIFTFTNTGNTAEQWNISLSESLSSYGITLYGNTSSNPTLQEITMNGWNVSNNISIGSSVQAWIWADFVDSPPGTVGNIYINHTSLQA